jgi:hypothetical protein
LSTVCSFALAPPDAVLPAVHRNRIATDPKDHVEPGSSTLVTTPPLFPFVRRPR